MQCVIKSWDSSFKKLLLVVAASGGEVVRPDRPVAAQSGRFAMPDRPPLLDDVMAVGQFEQWLQVLVDHKNRGAF